MNVVKNKSKQNALCPASGLPQSFYLQSSLRVVDPAAGSQLLMANFTGLGGMALAPPHPDPLMGRRQEGSERL